MTNHEDLLIQIRQSSQSLSGSQALNSSEVVDRLVGVQAQDERGAHWSIGLRSQNSTEQDVNQSIADRKVLRTWLFRGTLHYVASKDLKWLLNLLSPRIIKGNARRYEQLGLDDAAFMKSQGVIERTLKSQVEATRSQLKSAFKQAAIPAEGQQVPYLLQRATLDGLVYVSRMQGRDTVFRLVSELDLPDTHIGRQDALVQLANRYFRGHGPASLHDFAWWAGLTVSVAREAIAGCEGLEETEWNGKPYFFFKESSVAKVESRVYLLPSFDDYFVSYSNRDLILGSVSIGQVKYGGGMFRPFVVINGRVSGTWHKEIKKNEIQVNIHLFIKSDPAIIEMIDFAGQELGHFYRKPVKINLLA